MVSLRGSYNPVLLRPVGGEGRYRSDFSRIKSAGFAFQSFFPVIIALGVRLELTTSGVTIPPPRPVGLPSMYDTASSGGRVRTPSIGHQKSAFCLLNYSRMILLRGYGGDRTRNLRGHNPALLPNELHTQLLPHGSNAELLVQSQTGCQLHQGGMIFSCQVGKAGFEPTMRPAPKAGGRPNCPTSRSLRTASRVERNRTSVVSLPKGVPYHPAPTRWSPQRDSHPHDLSVTAV